MNIPGGNLQTDGTCYAIGKRYLGKYTGNILAQMSHGSGNSYRYFFDNGFMEARPDTQLFTKVTCQTNSSSSSSAAANSGLFNKFFPYNKRFALTHTPEGQVPYPKNNNTVSNYSNYKSNSSGFNNNAANNFNNYAAKAMVNPKTPSPTGKDLQALLQKKFGNSSAAGKRKTRTRKMRTRASRRR